MKLHRFVNSQSREHLNGYDYDHGAVSESLQAIIEVGGGRRLEHSQVVTEHLERVARVTDRQEKPPTPFAAPEKIREIDDAVQHQKPGDRKMPVPRTRQPSADRQPCRRRDSLPRVPSVFRALWTQRRIGRE